MTKHATAKSSTHRPYGQTRWRLLSRPFSEQVRAVRPVVVQPKLRLGPVDDAYEQEADGVAKHFVTCMSGSARRGGPRLPKIQPLAGNGGAALVPLEISDGIEATKRRGQTLPKVIREETRNAFGTGFDGVRVHIDEYADRLNHLLGANAFTTGHDIYFRRGKYCPETDRGKYLLAHELTHVVQQEIARPSRSERQLAVTDRAGLGSLTLQRSSTEGIFTTKSKKKIASSTIAQSGYNFIEAGRDFQDFHIASTDAGARNASMLRVGEDKEISSNTVVMDSLDEIENKVLNTEWGDNSLRMERLTNGLELWHVRITCRHRSYTYGGNQNNRTLSAQPVTTVDGGVWLKVRMTPKSVHGPRLIKLVGVAGLG